MRYLVKTVLIALLFSAVGVSAQKKKKEKTAPYVIKGFVKDSLKNPIAYATIFVDDIKQKEKTNARGYYSLKLRNKPNKILFLTTDYKTIELVYSDKTEKKNNKNKVLALNKKKKKGDRKNDLGIENNQFRDIYHYLRSRVAGVFVRPSDNKIFVRGLASINSGTDPLFLLNGSIITNVSSINPNDIKSVEVIKGAELANYGMRAANGVIKITTFKE